MPELQSRLIQLPPMSLKADLGPRSINDAERTVDLILTTVAGVKRYDWRTGKEYIEVLSMDPAHVKLDRINGGAPLLDSHSAYSVADILGTVVPGSVSTTKKALLGTVRFSKRQSVEEIWQDVKDSIIRDVSIGYRVYAYEEKPGKTEGALPIRVATSWEPFECSLVPIPADAAAKVRADAAGETNACELRQVGGVVGEVVVEVRVDGGQALAQIAEITRAAEEAAQKLENMPAPPAKEKTMDEKKDSPAESFRADLSLTPPPEPKPAPTPTARDEGAAAERVRVAGIRRACLNGKVSRALEDELIDGGVSLTDAQDRILDEVGKRDVDVPAGSSRPTVTVGEDPFIHVRAGIEEALLHKAHPYRPEKRDDRGRVVEPECGFKMTDRAREYRGLSLRRLAERYLVRMGIRTERMSEIEIAGIALGLTQRGGMHSTSDFPYLLADVSGKVLRAAYMEAPQTFGPLTRIARATDFKPMKRNQLGEAPSLEEVKEHGEVKSGTIGEAKEEYSIATYAKKFGITRKAIINDDLDAFSRLPLMFGRAARNKESDLVWAQLTSNPTMGDGNSLFDATNHSNYQASGAVISVDSISEGRTAMRTQKGVDGATLLNINPRYILVPAALETKADQFVSAALLAAQASNVNPFAGRLSVISEPRLDAVSALSWYLAGAIADGVDIFELAMLEGQDGPLVEQDVNLDVDGVQIRVRHDIGAKIIDWRALWKNAGAEES